MGGLTRNFLATFLAKAWSSLLSVALVPLYIKFLGVEAYGVVGAFVTIQALISLLDLGFGPALTRELARLSPEGHDRRQMRDLVRSLEIIYWLVAALIVVAVGGAAPVIAQHWLRPHHISPGEIARALEFAGLALAVQWPGNLYGAGLMGLQRQSMLGLVTALGGTIRAALTVGALWQLKPTLPVFFLAQACGNGVQTLATAAILWSALPRGASRSMFSPTLVRAVWRFATGMVGISFTAIALTQLDKAILSKTLPLQSFGYYVVASTLAGGLYVLISPVFAVLFPKFSQLVAQGDRRAIEALYGVGSQFMSVVILPVTAVVMMFSQEILELWTHNQEVAENSHVLLSLLILGNAMNGLMNIPYAVQLANGWTGLAFYSNIIAILSCAPLIAFLSLHIGALGGALVWVLLTFGYIVASLPVMHARLLHGRLRRWYIVDVGFPALASFAVAVAARMLLPEPLGDLRGAFTLVLVTLGAFAAALLVAPDLRALVARRVHPPATVGSSSV